MTIKLAHKFFIAHALIILALVTAFLSFSYVSNQSLVSNAMNGIDKTVMEELAPLLADSYVQSGSFDHWIQEPGKWNELVDGTFLRVFFSISPMPHGAPAPMPAPSGGQALKPCEPPFATFLQHLTLLAADKTPLIKALKPAPDTHLEAIKVHGRIVGWLQVAKINVDALPYAGYFFHQQVRFTLWVVACAGLLALALGYWLAQHMTQPIRLITEETQKLAQRDFTVNIAVHTGDELEALGKHITSIAQELSMFSQQQKQWLLDISHELRTPLTILYGEFNAMLEDVTPINASAIISLHEEVVHLKRIVDDLHALSMMDAVTFQLNCALVDADEFMREQVVRYGERFAEQAIKITYVEVKPGLLINVDADRLGQVVRNLFDNNARYTDSPGEVQVTLESDDKTVRIQFDDTGPGVPAELINKVFDRLYRVDSARTRVSGGAGLGLSICKNIIEAHQGYIHASASRLGGLCIVIGLPLFKGAQL